MLTKQNQNPENKKKYFLFTSEQFTVQYKTDKKTLIFSPLYITIWWGEVVGVLTQNHNEIKKYFSFFKAFIILVK